MSKFNDVTVEKFDALVSKNIVLRNCPNCNNFGGQIIVDMPMCGKEGAYCKCNHCGFETRRHSTNIVISDKRKRIATPTIEKSLMAAIRQAVYDFNRKDRNTNEVH